MDFDHKDPKRKKYNLSCMMSKGMSRKSMLEELNKCEVVCANCHRIRTYSRVNRWSYRPTELAATIIKLKDRPCLRCGGVFPPECIDFDHRDPLQKKITIGRYKGRSIGLLNTLLEEVEKCDIICANCHRIRTAEKGGWQSSARTPQAYRHLTTSEEFDIKSRAQHAHKKPVMDQFGNRYESANSAARALDVWSTEIFAVLSGKRPHVKGTVLRYV